ncbi:hypothetical protein Tco_0535130 [Tanacetum coccineum]
MLRTTIAAAAMEPMAETMVLAVVSLDSVDDSEDIFGVVGSYDLDPILQSRSCKDKNDPKWDRDLASLSLDR